MRELDIRTAEVFLPLCEPARYKAAYGGRGSGKSHFFAEKMIEDCLSEPGDFGEGLRAVCIREVQKDLAQSSKALLEVKLRQLGITEGDGFKVYRDVIKAPKDGLIIFKGMNDYTADSIKSLENFKRAWWEESQTATRHSLNLLTPTLRAPGSEIWFSWNPKRKTDPVDVMFRGEEKPTGAIVVRANWRDNPWYKNTDLDQERLDCMRMQPDQYDHVWEGGYVSVVDGAYFAKQLTEARQQGRIGRVSPDPLMAIRIHCDLGGTGSKSDAFAMWASQWVGKEVRVLNYYEAVGQPLPIHVQWLRDNGYEKAEIVLPHDGETHDRIANVSFESAFKAAGFRVRVVKNQGAGAAKQRIEAARRLFPSVWFNEATCSAGLDALGWYHEKKNDVRQVGLGPEHDWSSHGADAYGLMCVDYKPPTSTAMAPIAYNKAGIV